MSIFEQATRMKLRFASNKGELSVEHLWDLPLQSKNGFDLDTLARDVNTKLRAASEDSFVQTRPNPAKSAFELSLEILKHIIAVKLADNEAARNATQRAAERQRLLEALANKEVSELNSLSADELRKRLAQLEG